MLGRGRPSDRVSHRPAGLLSSPASSRRTA
jgi:hypothetical protein